MADDEKEGVRCTMRNKIILLSVLTVLIVITLILVFMPKSEVRFDGDRVSNPGYFALRFDRMNTADAETMELEEGDALHVTWQIESGYLDIVIGQENEEAIYQANRRAAGDKADFYVGIPKTGAYTITVSGREAKGQTAFLKTENK